MKKLLFVLTLAVILIFGVSGFAFADQKYDIDVTVSYGDGDADASKSKAEAGDKVYLYLDPDEDETLSKFVVKDDKGKRISLDFDEEKRNVYSFIMPEEDINISVYYSDVDYDIDIRIEGSDEQNYLTYSEFDDDDTSYSVRIDGNEYFIRLYVKYDASYDVVVRYGDDKVAPSKVTSTYDVYKIFVDPFDLENVKVSVRDDDDHESYLFKLKADAVVNAELDSLVLYSEDGEEIPISPDFQSDVYNYVATVPYSIDRVYLIAAGEGAITVLKDNGNYADLKNNWAFQLKEGLNQFVISVGTNHYYLNVYRGSYAVNIGPSTQFISIDGEDAVRIPAYNINGNNFVKLRAVADLLDDTNKQFAVGYEPYTKLIMAETGRGYSEIGGELDLPVTYGYAVPTRSTLMINGDIVYPTGYNIDGSNYYLLRDLAALFNFNISYRGSTVYVDTELSYGSDHKESVASKDNDPEFDVSMKLEGNNDAKYMTKSAFDPEQTSYDIDVDINVDYLDLYVYMEDDYRIKVFYDGETLIRRDRTDKYYLYRVYVDVYDLDDLDVVLEDGDDTVTYRFRLVH